MNPGLLFTSVDAELSSIFRSFFGQLGFDVETATDGLECLDKLRRFQPAVLIVDLEMLWGGGDGVLARMHEDRDLPRVPIVLITGDDPLPVLAERSRVPPSFCFRKPFRLSAILDRLGAVASTSQFQVSNTRASPGGVA